MRYVWVVVRREYLERVRSKGFILSTVAGPILMIGLIAVSATMGMSSDRSGRQLALRDETGQLAELIVPRLERSGYEVEINNADPVDLDSLVVAGDIRAYLIVDDLTMSEGVVTYRAKDSPGSIRSGVIRAAVVQGVLEARMEVTDGLEALLDGGELEFETVGAEDDTERTASLLAAVVGGMLLYFSLLLYGSYVLRSVLEEKRNRVVEVVISSIRPWQLMMGKIVGVGAVGLTQLGIWVGFGALMATTAIPALAANWSLLSGVDGALQYLPGPGTILLFMVFYLLGYFLYSSLFAAVGAMCSKEEEAQQAQMPLILLLVVPFILQMGSIEGGGPAWLDWAALFPFFSPILMFPRAVTGAAPVWMIGLSLVLMAVAIVLTAWVAGRIYRVGILMQGKRPTLPELVRWIRQA